MTTGKNAVPAESQVMNMLDPAGMGGMGGVGGPQKGPPGGGMGGGRKRPGAHGRSGTHASGAGRASSGGGGGGLYEGDAHVVAYSQRSPPDAQKDGWVHVVEAYAPCE